MHQERSKASGFTLVELVVVLIIMSVLASVFVVIIRRPLQSYTETAATAELADTADSALRMMARELRGSVPNSVRVVNDGNAVIIEFVPVVGGGRYVGDDDNLSNGELPLSFTNAANVTFSAAYQMTLGQAAPGRFVVIHNLGDGIAYADVYAGGNRSEISAVGTNAAGQTITLVSNGFAAAAAEVPPVPPPASPTQRFNIASTPVSYRCEPLSGGMSGRLMRIDGYAFGDARPVSGPLVASGVNGCAFNSFVLANVNAALVDLSLELLRGGQGAVTVRLFRQVQLDNTP